MHVVQITNFFIAQYYKIILDRQIDTQFTDNELDRVHTEMLLSGYQNSQSENGVSSNWS